MLIHKMEFKKKQLRYNNRIWKTNGIKRLAYIWGVCKLGYSTLENR